MGELLDKAKGKLKEVVGAVTGDRSLEAEGKVDRAKGEAKEKVEDAKRAVRDAVDDARARRDEP
ncbi:CsbD family protein [Myxococcus stipitatus]|uniref:CsbD family protein n=1 Tax=Myxococcus stipitatus (strain DSM 14675 / JCM 12634 / Mx s8) TaxID=1278073 RepID=L7ULD2_MYXSD|nr:CsbD family protein [Myxococcus stipitatus]AGC48818.1 CsbD family protein [Myxococcus stipitatus DSM 14675]